MLSSFDGYVLEGIAYIFTIMQGLIRLLSTCASGSALGAKTLLLLGISGILKDILSGSGVSTNASVSPALNRPQEQVGSANFPGHHSA